MLNQRFEKSRRLAAVAVAGVALVAVSGFADSAPRSPLHPRSSLHPQSPRRR